MLTAIHSDSFANMQLGAGLFLKNFDPDAAEDAAQLLDGVAAAIHDKRGLIGATRDGGCFRCTPRLREVDADGLRGFTRGGTVLDGWTITLSGTMMEITPDNAALALAAADVVSEGCRTTVRLRSRITEEDYVPRLCWIGNTARGLVLIELTDVLNTGGMSLSFGDQTEGSMPFSLRAHGSAGDDGQPCRVIFFREARP